MARAYSPARSGQLWPTANQVFVKTRNMVKCAAFQALARLAARGRAAPGPNAETKPCVRRLLRASFEESEFKAGDIRVNTVEHRDWTAGAHARRSPADEAGGEIEGFFGQSSYNHLKTHESLSLKKANENKKALKENRKALKAS